MSMFWKSEVGMGKSKWEVQEDQRVFELRLSSIGFLVLGYSILDPRYSMQTSGD